jgi:hypothetical protein
VISYLGDVDPGVPADPGLVLDGGDGPLSLFWGFVVLAVFSAAIYAYAIAVRLPAHRAAENLSPTRTDEPAAI